MSYGPITMVHEHVTSNSYTSARFKDYFRILNAHIHYTADATVGNRSIAFEVYLADGHTLWDSRSDANQGAGTLRHYSFAGGLPRETSFSGNDDLYLPIPQELILVPGSYIKAYDANNVSASDTFHITYQYEEI